MIEYEKYSGNEFSQRVGMNLVLSPPQVETRLSSGALVDFASDKVLSVVFWENLP